MGIVFFLGVINRFVAVDMGVFLNEIVGKIPNFVGIKYTDKNMEQGLRAVKANAGNFAVFLGCDQVRKQKILVWVDFTLSKKYFTLSFCISKTPPFSHPFVFQVMAGAFSLGFDSAIATSLNMFPYLGLNILKSVQESNVEEARENQTKLNKAIEIITRNGAWVQTMKEAMTILTPINCGPPREPLTRLTNAQVKQMAAELKDAAY